jgi:hypothetical protein
MTNDPAITTAEAVFTNMTIGGPTPRREVLDRARNLVGKLWVDGVLPRPVGETQWVVGYEVHYTHMSGLSLIPITVGPKKPSRFRIRYARGRSFDAWGREQK